MMISVAGQAQYIISASFKHAYTKNQVDSILNAVGLPAGVITTRYDVRVYKVTYHSFDVDSMPTIASGLMVVPQATPCEVPILSFQHNNVIRKSDVPSRYSYNSQWYVGLAAGSLGNITLMPDGIGLGDGPGLHPFLHMQTEATAVIDMIRAAKEVVDTMGNSPDEQLFLAGIAEGAYATLAAHQYIQAYLDSQMHVTASGGIAGYYDMSGTMVHMILSDSNYVDPSYLPDLLFGYNKAYHFFAHDSDIMVYPYDSVLPPLFNGNNGAYTINTHMPPVPKYILRQDQIDSLANDSTNFLRLLLKKNDLYNWAPTSPVKLFYCNADEYVPYQNSIVAYEHFVQNGSTMVDTINIGATLNHAECGQFSVLGALSIINLLSHHPIAASVTVTNNTSPAIPNGAATVADSLGDAPYTWRWSTGDSTAAITGLAAGTYYVTTTDRAHCMRIDSAVISLVDGMSELVLANINIYPNPTQGTLMIENKNTSEKLTQIQILDISGNIVHATTTQSTDITKIDIGEEAKGIYFLNIRSQSGKELHRKIVLL
jgi:hypothetical protein